MELFKLLGTIAIENSDANSAIDETTGKAEQSESKFSKAFGKIGNAATKVGQVVAAGLAVDKIKDFGISCSEAAAEAQATISQFSQVFGDYEGQASQSLSAIADSAGIAENRMKGSYTKIAAFAKTTGMETADALSLADRAMVAIADSAAFYDRSLEETTESLQSFLKGNYENDAALGLSCTEVTRNAAANELYGKSFKDLSEEQKQLTLLKMVEDANALSGALGQASRESDTWNNQTGNLKQTITDLRVVIGERLLPVLVPIIEKVANIISRFTELDSKTQNIILAIGGVVAAFVALAPVIGGIASTVSVIGGAFMALNPIVLVIIATIGALVAVGVTLYKNWDTIKKKASELGAAIAEKFNAIKETIGNVMQVAKDTVNEKLQNMKDAYEEKGGGIQGIAAAMMEGIKGYYTAGFTFIDKLTNGKLSEIANAFQSRMQTARDGVKNAIEKIKSFFNFSWSLPKLKLPHFKIKGSFSLNPPSVPSFSIDWYKKAMDEGMILNKPTAFGINSKGQIMAGGEAGSETVVGTESLMSMIQNAAKTDSDGLALAVREAILEAFNNLDITANIQIIPDDRGIFKIVEKQAVIKRKSTGREVFA